MFGYTICFADRANAGVVIPVLRLEFAITNMQSGSLMSLCSPAIADMALDVHKNYNYVFASFATCALLCFITSCTIEKPVH